MKTKYCYFLYTFSKNRSSDDLTVLFNSLKIPEAARKQILQQSWYVFHNSHIRHLDCLKVIAFAIHLFSPSMRFRRSKLCSCVLVQALGAQKVEIKEISFGGVLIFGIFVSFGSLNTNLRFANKNFPENISFTKNLSKKGLFLFFKLIPKLCMLRENRQYMN